MNQEELDTGLFKFINGFDVALQEHKGLNTTVIKLCMTEGLRQIRGTIPVELELALMRAVVDNGF